MIVLDLSILNQKGTPMFNSDTFANRPAFGIVGRIFISTDTKEFYRDTGTSWELIGGPGSGTITGSGAATQVAFWNGTSTISGSNNLWWDSTNNYLGINTNTPTTALDVHHSTNSGAIFNQTTATNNNTINFQTSGSGRWRIGNFYTAGADDFGIFDVVGALQQFTILKTTGQTFVGAKTTASGRLVVNSATDDNHLQIVGANAPSIRIDNAGSGGTQRFVFGLATATNNFIQGATAGQFCISTQSAGAMLFGMWQTTNASEVMRITTANNLLIGSSVDNGNRLQVYGTGYINNRLTIDGTSTGQYIQFYNSGADRAHLYWNESANSLTLGTYFAGGNIRFETGNNAFAAIINASGNLGLGTASPNISGVQRCITISSSESALELASASNVIQGTISCNTNGLGIGGVGLFGIRFFTSASGATTERARFTNGGNILVGSSVDNGSRLQISGSSTFSDVISITSNTSTSYALNIIGRTTAGNASTINFFNNAASTRYGFVYIDSSTFEIGSISGSNIPIIFLTNQVERMRIKSSGVINLSNVPTSSVGLVSGDIYQTAGVLNIVP